MEVLYSVLSWGTPVGIGMFFCLSGIGTGVFLGTILPQEQLGTTLDIFDQGRLTQCRVPQDWQNPTFIICK